MSTTPTQPAYWTRTEKLLAEGRCVSCGDLLDEGDHEGCELALRLGDDAADARSDR